jgi:hypothetical protein
MNEITIEVPIELVEVFQGAMKKHGIEEAIEMVLDGLFKAGKLVCEEGGVKGAERLVNNAVRRWTERS